ncbi:TetR/AcrR family transcriptional regulator [Nocardia gipuzkoensis]|uniref:TetR/AcrR family transcriptional regulator n=1 Tax=Nocardia gipuzkoensis TaxID=2749991 RepID=UPI003EE142C6
MQAAPGRPRDQRTHQVIVRAAEELVTEIGYAETSLNAVAARAGVGKDTVYRRWSGKPEPVIDELFTTIDTAPVPDTGALGGDITALSAELVAEFNSPAASALPGLRADFAADPHLRRRLRTVVLAPARDRTGENCDRARARGGTTGEIPVDPLLGTLVGAVLVHVGLLGELVSNTLASQLGEIVTTGIGAR